MVFPILGGNSAVAGGYSIDNSLRFNDGDSPYLYLSQTAGNRRTLTFSTWLKRSTLGDKNIFNGTDNSSEFTALYFTSADELFLYDWRGAEGMSIKTTQKFRDTSAWYHIVIAFDTTQSTASNRVKFYVNGEQITDFTSSNYPAQNLDLMLNVNSSFTTKIGVYPTANTLYFDGYMAETCLIEDSQLTPTSFGETDESSGIWKPIDISDLTFGDEGFYLDFENSGSLGTDQSGNGNNFTPTNLASTDQTTDTPTNNFATFNPLRHNITTGGSESEGNLKYVNSGNVQEDRIFGNIGLSSGKWYWEGLCTGTSPNCQIGLNSTSQLPTNDTYRVTYKSSDGATVGLGGSTYSTYTNGDIIGVAFDADNSQITLYKNNTAQTGSPVSITVDSQGMQPFFVTFSGEGASNSGWVSNFGQEGSFAGNKTAQGNADGNGYGDFYYTPPSGYLALCTQNLATALSPTIDDGSAYFQTLTFTGNGSTQTLTFEGNSDLQADFMWFKERNLSANWHQLWDTSRGIGVASSKRLYSNATSAEENITSGAGVRGVGTDTVEVGSTAGINGSSQPMVLWGWKANGGTTSSNTDGSITSTVQANTTAGFSIVTYTGTGANATIGHGLGKAPEWIMIKRRDVTGEWIVYQKSFSEDGSGEFNLMNLNDTDATQEFGAFNFMQSTSPTSSVFYTDGQSEMNASGGTFVAYCFAPIEGYSKAFSYTGNGNADGTYVSLGFRPQFIIVKRTDSTGDWHLVDNKRNGFNVDNDVLLANKPDAEFDVIQYDILSNGFKLRSTASSNNSSGGSYIGFAIASNPFVSSTGIPVTAR